jgi:hypothetical protein
MDDQPAASRCQCGHSFAAHYMTHSGMCGFCYCKALVGTVRLLRAISRAPRRLLLLEGG